VVNATLRCGALVLALAAAALDQRIVAFFRAHLLP